MKIAMKTFLSILIILSLSGSAFSQEQVLTDNLQSVVENSEIVATDVNSSIQEAVEEIIETKIVDQNSVLVGAETGLYQVIGETKTPLWQDGYVQKILKVNDEWFFLTSEGIIYSKDLVTFEKRNNGLPVHTIKKYDGKEKSFEYKQKTLKDFSIHPEKPEIMATATKDAVYLSRDAGLSWESIGFSAKTPGIKSLVVMNLPIITKAEDGTLRESDETQLVVCMSHAIYGFSYYLPNEAKPKWIDIEKGFENMPKPSLTEEIACMIPEINVNAEGKKTYDIFFGTSFIPRLYKLDWKNKKVILIWKDSLQNDTQESLVKLDNTIVYLNRKGFNAIDLTTGKSTLLPTQVQIWKELIKNSPENYLCAFLPATLTGNKTDVSLTELWMLQQDKKRNEYQQIADGKKSLYMPAHHAIDKRLDEHLKTVKDNKLNSIVIDMKDDYGGLRFDAKTPALLEKKAVSSYAVKLDEFVPKMKAEGLYLIARIVVFKDRNLYRFNKNEMAVYDKSTNAPWRGIRRVQDKKDAEGNVILNAEGNPEKETVYFDEYWVDPYCEKVWEYNIQVAKELIERGFDEIQFDYIRFPTDGTNLGQTKYRYQEKGMDMESALISFLSYARENIKAPIGIDIYGSNGWYRSGSRTGQDVELLSDYVDVICPMFYPNHFEQNFLAYQPEIERPYRIYYYGTYRNAQIARDKVLIRPWAQAFYLNVSYDRKYYNKDYVRRQIYGVRDSMNNGYMYWNNSGRYTDISPDILDTDPYPWVE